MTPQELIRCFDGSIAATARALGIKPPSVSEWIANGAVPIDRQCQAEIVTGGKVRADRAKLGLNGNGKATRPEAA